MNPALELFEQPTFGQFLELILGLFVQMLSGLLTEQTPGLLVELIFGLFRGGNSWAVCIHTGAVCSVNTWAVWGADT